MENGFHQMSESAYRALPYLNQSSLKHILKTPAHFQAALKAEQSEESDNLLLGSLVHCMLLEPLEVARRYVMAPEEIESRASKAYKDFAKEAGSRKIIKSDMWAKAMDCVEAVKKHNKAGALFHGGQAELVGVWDYKGIKCKAKFDYVDMNGTINDLKTTKDASTLEFKKSCANYGYHFQAAFYIEAYKKLTGKHYGEINYNVTAVETGLFPAVQVFTFNSEFLDIGFSEMYRALDLYIECLHADKWPSYGENVVSLMPPSWMRKPILGGEW